MTEDGVGVRGGGKLHQFALPFGRRGLVHDDANTFPRFDRATPPEWLEKRPNLSRLLGDAFAQGC